MTKRIDRNQVFGTEGNLLSEEVVEVIEYPSPEQSAVMVAKMMAAEKLRGGLLSEPEVEAVSGLYDDWQVGLTVAVEDVLRYDGTLVECIQAHTTQQDWIPPATPSLWKVHRTDDGTTPLAWMPGLALTVDDQVTYDGVLYDVLQAHTSQETWTPPVTPALFAPATD